MVRSHARFLAEVLQAIADRGRQLAGRGTGGGDSASAAFARLCELLLVGRGEATGLAVAAELLALWRGADSDERLEILLFLADQLGPDKEQLEHEIAAYLDGPDQSAALRLHAAAEPRRQELFRRLNTAQGATGLLLEMRHENARHMAAHPRLRFVESDLVHLLSSWFNRGFLTLQRIEWSSPANILEKIIRYEAVHEIHSWDDLKRRLAPGDRRCFAFLHPQLRDEPIIFVEVALTRYVPSSIDEVLHRNAPDEVSAEEANTAVFYSISNCQPGLRGISFGNFLLKQVIEDLQSELPNIVNYVTLSPLSGFASWLREKKQDDPLAIGRQGMEVAAILEDTSWPDQPDLVEEVKRHLPPLAAAYLIQERSEQGRPRDPVARFHLGNGARLERLNVLGDRSPRAIADAHGLMVNYRYMLDELIANHERFATRGEVVAASSVRRQLASYRRQLSPQGRAQRVPRPKEGQTEQGDSEATATADIPLGR